MRQRHFTSWLVTTLEIFTILAVNINFKHNEPERCQIRWGPNLHSSSYPESLVQKTIKWNFTHKSRVRFPNSRPVISTTASADDLYLRHAYNPKQFRFLFLRSLDKQSTIKSLLFVIIVVLTILYKWWSIVTQTWLRFSLPLQRPVGSWSENDGGMNAGTFGYKGITWLNKL